MVTFLVIILVLVVLNVALLVFSNSNSRARVNKLTDKMSTTASSKIYPLDLNSSKYKKAI